MTNKIFGTVLTSTILVISAGQGLAGESDRRVVEPNPTSISPMRFPNLQRGIEQLPQQSPDNDEFECSWWFCDPGTQNPSPRIERQPKDSKNPIPNLQQPR